MNITSFKVSQDKSSLQLFLENASTANKLSLWTHKTFKTVGLEIDLTAKLDGNSIQSITITLEDLGLLYFDGVYFIEVKNDTSSVCGITAELARYKECIIEKVLANKDCESCLVIEDMPTLNAHVLLYELTQAISLGLKQEILTMVYALDKFCSNTCNSCGKYKNI